MEVHEPCTLVFEMTYYLNLGIMVTAVGKIFDFLPQGPIYDLRLSRDLNLCVAFFPDCEHKVKCHNCLTENAW